MQWEGGVLPHKTTGTTDEEDILFHLVNIILFEPSILWPACYCSCARHYLLRSLPVFSLFRQNGGCTRQRYCDHEWWPLSIGNDQGWGQTSCCRLYSILVSYRCEIYWPDNAFQDRMVVAIVIHRTPLVHRSLFSTILINSDTLFTGNFPNCWWSVLF